MVLSIFLGILPPKNGCVWFVRSEAAIALGSMPLWKQVDVAEADLHRALDDLVKAFSRVESEHFNWWLSNGL